MFAYDIVEGLGLADLRGPHQHGDVNIRVSTDIHRLFLIGRGAGAYRIHTSDSLLSANMLPFATGGAFAKGMTNGKLAVSG